MSNPISEYIRQPGDDMFAPNGEPLGKRPYQIQVQVSYHTAILVPEELGAKWGTLTQEEKEKAMYDYGQDPQQQQIEGHIDISDPTGIEFLDCEAYEQWNG